MQEVEASIPVGPEGLEELRSQSGTIFRKGEGARPDVRIVEYNGNPYVLKDYDACSRWFAVCVGTSLAWREANSLKKLDALPGIPQLIAKPTPRSLLMEYIPDTNRAKKMPEHINAEFFDKLSALVVSMHDAGVAHGDLRRSSNILADASGNPHLVDFVSCVYEGAAWNLLARWIFKQVKRADRNAVIKLKRRFAPDLLTDDELQFADHSPGERVIRAIGNGLRASMRFLLTGRGKP